jgi:hypothetical protein
MFYKTLGKSFDQNLILIKGNSENSKYRKLAHWVLFCNLVHMKNIKLVIWYFERKKITNYAITHKLTWLSSQIRVTRCYNHPKFCTYVNLVMKDNIGK